ncbi:hypothetical protein MTP09_01155 [Chryseobacterium suipulveris]|uniref:C-type lysozyme inhibitor domain-containing protein n=1 Tax=Chryseobacterium suipulveris TaxID=2929800 RepID=A0ABY4BQ00_9FLAO|nr:hypothetical protein [Chryseobacterium suipulveris]UOE41283.1 hypothetical protein MTP09_01155 [Chryseobacterium suipulveris]
MKNLFVIVLSVFLLNACKKQETSGQESSEVSAKGSGEVGLEQKPVVLKSDTGEEISVTYYAEGGVVAVKLQKAGESEQKLNAKTTNAKGNPIFTSEEIMWEMTNDGTAGKLTDKAGNAVDYRNTDH